LIVYRTKKKSEIAIAPVKIGHFGAIAPENIGHFGHSIIGVIGCALSLFWFFRFMTGKCPLYYWCYKECPKILLVLLRELVKYVVCRVGVEPC
jgi:hypothetical protein